MSTEAGPPVPRPADQWDRSLRIPIVALLLIAATLAGAYVFLVPVAVRGLAARVPDGALDLMGAQVLASLDQDVLEPSTLSEPERRELAEAFKKLAVPSGPARRARLEFRKSATLGANAMALPSGIIVVTDDLIGVAKDTEEVVAVLAHEVGHLAGRHGVRAVIRSAFVSALITVVVGDASALAAAAPAALLDARYSRNLEREADAYAVDALQAIGIPPTRLADVLERMEAVRGRGGERPTGAFAYLSTHPTTEERLRTLRGR